MADNFVVANITSREPGVSVNIFESGDVGLSLPNQKSLIFGYMGAGGTGTPNQVVRGLSQDQVDLLFKPASMIAQAYAAAKAAAPLGDVYMMPILEPSGGTAQVVKVEIAAAPSGGVLGTNTVALAADTVYVRQRGRGVAVGFKAGDTFEAIAIAIQTAWNLLEAPPAAISRSTAELSLTAPHKGAFDNGAVEVTFASKGASGVAAICGAVVFTGAAGVLTTGSYTLTLGAQAVQATIADTSTAAQSATALVNKFLTGSFPVRAAQAGSPDGTVKLFYVDGRPVRPPEFLGQLSGVTTQTAALTKGTAGAGAPSLTDALAALAASDTAYRAWSCFWLSTSEVGATAASIEAETASDQGAKGQIAIFCSTAPLAALLAADLVETTSPKLSTTSRYVPMWAPAAGAAGWELSARLAAAIGSESDAGRNWNGYDFASTDAAPLAGIHPADQPSRDDRNAAIGAGYPPVTVSQRTGNLTLVWGGTARKIRSAADKKRSKISDIQTLDYLRADLAVALDAAFAGKRLKEGTPRTGRTVTVDDVKTVCFRWLVRVSEVDLVNDPERVRDAIQVRRNVVDPTRLDVNVPLDLLVDLDIISAVGVVS